jgi:AraC-like DNA-binding protein
VCKHAGVARTKPAQPTHATSIQIMYSPIKDGIDKSARFVRYTEAKPPSDLGAVVHCFWEIKTDHALPEDFYLHALPDACVNILFNQIDTDIAGVTALRTKYEALNLGKSFHYAGIQFLPGVWHGNRGEIVDHFVGTSYEGQLPLIQISKDLAPQNFAAKQLIMADLVKRLMRDKLVMRNVVTEKILASLNHIHAVKDMAGIVGLSPRQLQRTLKQATGFSPHDLLKVLRLQQSFKQHYLDLYADQSHFIHSFRKITGYTPAKYTDKFDV